jgi:hypothetical protein
MNQQKKRLAIIIGVIAVIVIGLFFAFSGRLYLRNPVVLLPDPQRVTSNDRSSSIRGDGGEYSALREVSGAGVTDSHTRDEALQLYAGRVIQLDSNCRAQPVTMVAPQKSVLMFDNESRYQRTVVVGARTYSINPFDYVLASFSTPGTFSVNCDSVEATALIAIQ